MTDDVYLKELVIMRLRAMPPNTSFSIGGFGDYSRDQLIGEVQKRSDIGQAAINLELKFLREMPRISEKLSLQ
ncbi:MAG: hypothetical protein WC607_04260 [Candidatus Micrarchaeia archaeon]